VDEGPAAHVDERAVIMTIPVTQDDTAENKLSRALDLPPKPVITVYHYTSVYIIINKVGQILGKDIAVYTVDCFLIYINIHEGTS
jgi:hypothetical protein